MGYFPNGTAGALYEEKYCTHCIHGGDGKDGAGCPVMLAHILYGYEQCDQPESILHLLIPRDENGWNEQCKMFVPKEVASITDIGGEGTHFREATQEELAPVLRMPDAALMLAGASANGKLAAIHANTHGEHSILVMQHGDLIWGYYITLPTREERKAESLRMLQCISEKNGWEIAPLNA